MERSGPAVTLNLNVRGLQPSATVAINELSNQLIRQGKRVHKLGLGQSPFPVPNNVVDELRKHAPEKNYLPVRGLWELREAIAAYHNRVDHIPIDADHVLVGPGSKELMFLLQLAFYGDLIVPAPCWVSYAPQARIIGRHVRFVQTTFEDKWRIRPDKLAQVCEEDTSRPRVLILNYPGNPDGGSYSPAELEKLAEVARAHNVVLLSDEIYGPLYHEHAHRSVAGYYPEGTIISNGISKWCGAGGWRLGTFAFPKQLKWLLDAMASLASETYTSTSAPIQWAAIAAFRDDPSLDNYLENARRILRALGMWCTKKLRATGARIHDPRGAFYLFPDFNPLAERLHKRGITGGRDLVRRSLEEIGVAFLPGEDFGMPEGDFTARMAYVDFDGTAALEASRAVPRNTELDETFLRTHCESVLTGIEKLCDWLS